MPCYRYKVCRADHPAALHRDFEINRSPDMFALRSFDAVQNDALERMRLFLMTANDVNHHFKDLEGGATQLWKGAELWCHLAVEEVLQHPNTDPNITHKETGATPLYMAAYFGHESGKSPSEPFLYSGQSWERGNDTPFYGGARRTRRGCKDAAGLSKY